MKNENMLNDSSALMSVHSKFVRKRWCCETKKWKHGFGCAKKVCLVLLLPFFRNFLTNNCYRMIFIFLHISCDEICSCSSGKFIFLLIISILLCHSCSLSQVPLYFLYLQYSIFWRNARGTRNEIFYFKAYNGYFSEIHLHHQLKDIWCVITIFAVDFCANEK